MLLFYLNEITCLKKLKSLNLGCFLLTWQTRGVSNGGFLDLFHPLVEISGYCAH